MLNVCMWLIKSLHKKVVDPQTVSRKHFAPDTFDKILVDAPCSGIGLIRRNLTLSTIRNQDFNALQEIQLQILDSVCQTLRKGGIITYSTCTIFDEETSKLLINF